MQCSVGVQAAGELCGLLRMCKLHDGVLWCFRGALNISVTL